MKNTRPQTYSAKYYHGKNAHFSITQVSFDNCSININVDNQQLHFNLDQCSIDSIIKNCPITLKLPQKKCLVFDANTVPYSLLEPALSTNSKLIFSLENNLLAFWSSFTVFLFSIFFIFSFMIPAMSKSLAYLVPTKWTHQLDDSLLSRLNRTAFHPSSLEDARKEKLEHYLKKTTNFEGRLIFKKAHTLNAFALSGNTVILTDSLVKKIKNRKHILGIFLHEIGHLTQRHLLSNIIASSATGLFLFFVIGDSVGLTESFASFGVTLLNLAYSRDFESQADQYAIKTLIELNLSPLCFSKGLEVFQKHKTDPLDLSYLSTHPNTIDRIHKIERKYPQAAPCN